MDFWVCKPCEKILTIDPIGTYCAISKTKYLILVPKEENEINNNVMNILDNAMSAVDEARSYLDDLDRKIRKVK